MVKRDMEKRIHSHLKLRVRLNILGSLFWKEARRFGFGSMAPVEIIMGDCRLAPPWPSKKRFFMRYGALITTPQKRPVSLSLKWL